MKISYVAELNAFMRYARNNSLTGRERLLWIALFDAANERAEWNAMTRDQDWPGAFFPVSNTELSLNSTLDKRGIEAVRNSLKQRGLIDFRAGNRNKKNPEYRIFYLSQNVGCKNAPNNEPNNVPKEAPNNEPNNVPKEAPTVYPEMPPYNIEEDKDKIGQEDDYNNHHHGSASESKNDLSFGLDYELEEFRKAPAGDREIVWQFARDTFSKFGGRSATETDCAKLYLGITAYDGQTGKLNFSRDKALIVRYAFKQAFLKNQAANWKYIDGCITNLTTRGIHTEAQLKAFCSAPPRRSAAPQWGKPEIPKGASGELGEAELAAIQRVLAEPVDD